MAATDAVDAVETAHTTPSWLQAVIETNLVYVKKFPAAVFTILLGFIVIRIIRTVVRRGMIAAKLDSTLQSMVLSAISFAGWTITFAAALNVLDLGQLSLALGGSIALIAMALATGLNSVTQDLLAGIFLLGDNDFTAGKRVRAGGVEGNITMLSVRKTKIRDKDGNLHTIPNRTVDGGTYVILAPEKEQPEVKSG